MFDMAPRLEQEITERAKAVGVSIDQYLSKLLNADPAPKFPPMRQEPAQETADRVQRLLTQWQAESGLPVSPGGFKSLAELSAEWAVEDARMTEEERAADRAFWAEYEQAIIDSPGVSI